MHIEVEPFRRQRVVTALRRASGDLTTASVRAMDERHEWFRALSAEQRSWITVVARTGIDDFVAWFRDGESDASDIFSSAPRAMLRHVSLAQTVELVRTTMDVMGENLRRLVDREDLADVEKALLAYASDVAFAAAFVYARAAELRGSWDARLEALVVNAIVRGEADQDMTSRASSLGWHATEHVCVLVGPARREILTDDIRWRAGKLGLDVLMGPLGDRMILILGGEPLCDSQRALAAFTELAPLFDGGPVTWGPIVDKLMDAGISARSAVAALDAAPGWPDVPDLVSADDLLPERTLAGDAIARSRLIEIARVLAAAGSDLLLTAEAFLAHQHSVEATARSLFVHANTVRYRLKRIQEVTGYALTESRDAYVLRLGLTLLRLEN